MKKEWYGKNRLCQVLWGLFQRIKNSENNWMNRLFENRPRLNNHLKSITLILYMTFTRSLLRRILDPWRTLTFAGSSSSRRTRPTEDPEWRKVPFVLLRRCPGSPANLDSWCCSKSEETKKNSIMFFWTKIGRQKVDSQYTSKPSFKEYKYKNWICRAFQKTSVSRKSPVGFLV